MDRYTQYPVKIEKKDISVHITRLLGTSRDSEVVTKKANGPFIFRQLVSSGLFPI